MMSLVEQISRMGRVYPRALAACGDDSLLWAKWYDWADRWLSLAARGQYWAMAQPPPACAGGETRRKT